MEKMERQPQHQQQQQKSEQVTSDEVLSQLVKNSRLWNTSSSSSSSSSSTSNEWQTLVNATAESLENKENEMKICNNNSAVIDKESDSTVSSSSSELHLQQQQQQQLQQLQQHQQESPDHQQTELMGMALKHWSVYLGNVLLNFIHKECKNSNNDHHHHHNQSDMSSSSTSSSTTTAAAIPPPAPPPSPAFTPITTNGAAGGYCPCCHYHNQMSAAQQQQQQQQPQAPNYYCYGANNGFFTQQQLQVDPRASIVQGKDPSVDFTQELVEESEDERCFDDMMGGADSVPPIDLPPCETGRLEEISELVVSCLTSPIRREKLAVAIENENYIKKLLALFKECETAANSGGGKNEELHPFYEIFKNIFLLNKNALFELMFAEDTIFDVVGCLEYDPSLPAPKRHREYLAKIARFHEVIKIKNPELLAKIHQTYRVQYIQDVVLPTPSVFEENMLSTLSSFIFFNKVEIVSLIQEDEDFLRELFAQLGKKSKGSVLFLKEFCTFSQTLQPAARESFFKTLNNLGILPALEKTLASDNRTTKAASIDILLFIVDFSPSMVREYMLQQLNNTEDDTLLMNVMIEQMTCDSDPEMGGAVQLMGIVRNLLDPENMLASVNKSEKTDFLNFFYKHCMHVFISPLMANTANNEGQQQQQQPPEQGQEQDQQDEGELAQAQSTGAQSCSSPQQQQLDNCTVHLLSLVLELLSFCVEHHTYHIKNYILHKDLLRRILALMKSEHTFLVLSALRFMRKIVALKDEFYNRYIIKGNLFAPVIDAFVANNGRYNLLDSAILEMFEFIKLEDIKSLCNHVVENFGPTLDKITYVQTFKTLKLRYDQHQDRLRDRPQSQLEGVGSILRPGRFRRDPRDLDEDEEMWFNDDDFENSDPPTMTVGATAATLSQQQQQQSSSSTSPSTSSQVNKESSVSTSSSATSMLVDEADDTPKAAASNNNNNALNGHVVGNSEDDEEPVEDGNETEAAAAENNSNNVLESNSNNSDSATSNTKKGLVDYDGDSDEDEEDQQQQQQSSSPSVSTTNTTTTTTSASPTLDDQQQQLQQPTNSAERAEEIPASSSLVVQTETEEAVSTSTTDEESSKMEVDQEEAVTSTNSEANNSSTTTTVDSNNVNQSSSAETEAESAESVEPAAKRPRTD